jgi:hypothetical protein
MTPTPTFPSKFAGNLLEADASNLAQNSTGIETRRHRAECIAFMAEMSRQEIQSSLSPHFQSWSLPSLTHMPPCLIARKPRKDQDLYVNSVA